MDEIYYQYILAEIILWILSFKDKVVMDKWLTEGRENEMFLSPFLSILFFYSNRIKVHLTPVRLF